MVRREGPLGLVAVRPRWIGDDIGELLDEAGALVIRSASGPGEPEAGDGSVLYEGAASSLAAAGPAAEAIGCTGALSVAGPTASPFPSCCPSRTGIASADDGGVHSPFSNLDPGRTAFLATSNSATGTACIAGQAERSPTTGFGCCRPDKSTDRLRAFSFTADTGEASCADGGASPSGAMSAYWPSGTTRG